MKQGIKPFMTKKYTYLTIFVGSFVSVIIPDVAAYLGGDWERHIFRVVAMLAFCVIIYCRKAIKRIQELEKEIEQKS